MKIIRVIGLISAILTGALYAQEPASLGKISITGDKSEIKVVIPIEKGDAAGTPSKTKTSVIIDVMPAVLTGAGEESVLSNMLVTKVKSEQYDKTVVRYTLTTSVEANFTSQPEKGRIMVTIVPAGDKSALLKKLEENSASMEKVAQVSGEEVVKTESKSSGSEMGLGSLTGKKGNIDQMVEHINTLNADLPSLLNMLCTEAGFNLVTSKSVSGVIPSIQLNNVPLRKVLDLILKQNGYAYVVEGNIIRVATPAEINTELESALLETRTYSLSFAKAANLQGAIQPFLSSKGRMQNDPRTNVLMITDIAQKHDDVAELIKKLDTKTAQVNIEAKLIDFSQDGESKLGIRWDMQGGGATSPIGTDIYPPTGNVVFRSTVVPPVKSGHAGIFQFGVAGSTNFWAALTALLTSNEANILAEPRITTLDNTTATMSIGQSYRVLSGTNTTTGDPILQSVEANISLVVTPQVNRNGYITLNVHPTVQAITDLSSFGISTRDVNNTVLVKDGESLVIGGLIREDEITTISKVPVLADIPLLGPLLFQSRDTTKTKRNLVIIVTPHVVD